MKIIQLSKKQSICKISPAGLRVGFGSALVDIIPARISVLFTILLLALTLFIGCGTYSSNSAESLSENDAYRQEEIAVRNDPIWTDEKNLRAMIISDLHYTENKDVNPAIVPGIALAKEITDVVAQEVIERHPDVFIMTGDNTDTGRAEDASGADHISQVFAKVLDKEGLRGKKRRRVQALLDRFFHYYGQGTLSEHKRQLMEDPYYDQMIDALWDYNYGPWIKEMIEKTKYSGRKLEVSW